MGLDITIITDNQNNIYTSNEDYFDTHSLSRTFCNFICRRHVIEHKPEFDQIGEITKTDISQIYAMEEYTSDDELEFLMEYAETEEEKQDIIKKVEREKAKLNGNIDKVLDSINTLINKLNPIENLIELLEPSDFDTLNNAIYFSDFATDKGQGYIDNNFGQDLRNFKRFLEFAKSRGATTVWFQYG